MLAINFASALFFTTYRNEHQSCKNTTRGNRLEFSCQIYTKKRNPTLIGFVFRNPLVPVFVALSWTVEPFTPPPPISCISCQYCNQQGLTAHPIQPLASPSITEPSSYCSFLLLHIWGCGGHSPCRAVSIHTSCCFLHRVGCLTWLSHTASMTLDVCVCFCLSFMLFTSIPPSISVAFSSFFLSVGGRQQQRGMYPVDASVQRC